MLKYFVAPFLLLLLISCDSNTANETTITPSIQTIDTSLFPDPRDKDTYIIKTTRSLTSANGTALNTQFSTTYTYTLVDEIPSKYNYLGTINGPYLLQTQTQEEQTVQLRYLSGDGKTVIIEDDLEIFSNVDFNLEEGSTQNLGIVKAGEQFKGLLTDILFNTLTGEQVGARISSVDLNISGLEVLDTAIGSFQTLKTNTFSVISEQINANTTESFGALILWIDTKTGLPVKSDLKLIIRVNGVIVGSGEIQTEITQLAVANDK